MATAIHLTGAVARSARSDGHGVFQPDVTGPDTSPGIPPASHADSVMLAAPATLSPATLSPATLAPATLAPATLALATLALATPSFVLGNFWPRASTARAAGGSAGPRTDDNSDKAVRGDLARSTYDVSGAGITIGILSDSFNLLGGMAADQADGDLPNGVTILKDGPAGSRDEGRAMADLIHRIAPGARIVFYTGTSNEADFASGINALQASGCTIIVDDLAYLDEPFFQDGGAVQAAVERAVAGGVSYFTAASNEGQDYVQQAFAPMRATLPGLPPGAVVQNFASRAAPQPWVNVAVPVGGQVLLDMQWDQPFASIGKGQASANSLGLALYDLSGRLLAAASNNRQGGNPDQVLSFLNTTAATSFRLVVFVNGGSVLPGLFKIINYGNGAVVGSVTGHGSGTVIGHEMVPGDNTVGAVAWSASARFGGTNTLESFSSVGSGDILFGADGSRLATPLSPAKVNFAAADGSITSVFAPFYGTSAAAPDAAAVAALVQQADPWLTPAQLSLVLQQTAAPASGAAYAGGAGMLQADSAVQMALGLARAAGH